MDFSTTPDGTRNDVSIQALQETQVLNETVAQLCKDLNCSEIEIPVPVLNEHALTALCRHVSTLLEQATEEGRLAQVLYRVDVPESWATEAMDLGGSSELAKRVVIRCVQKVVTRHRFSKGDP